MSSLFRQFSSSFVVDSSKLRRLYDVVHEKVRQNNGQVHVQLELTFSNGRMLATNSLDEIFQVDNSAKSRVQRLLLQVQDTDEGRPGRGVHVDFDGRPPVEVAIRSTGKDAGWASEAMSIAEEQVERTLQKGTMRALASQRGLGSMIMIGAMVVLAIAMVSVLDTLPGVRSRLVNTMWLNQGDLAEVSKAQNDPGSRKVTADEILARQVKNIMEEQARKASASRLLTWRSAFIIAPFLVAAISVLYLAITCYPPAVFVWGDAEEWYKGVVGRRRFVWSTIIVSLTVGILGNLFVFALGPHG